MARGEIQLKALHNQNIKNQQSQTSQQSQQNPDAPGSRGAHGQTDSSSPSYLELPEGVALDRAGRPTRDPMEALMGAQLPFGG